MSLLALIATHAAGGPGDPPPPVGEWPDYDPGADTTPYAMPTAAPYNVPTPAPTPTYDGSGQAIHPSVVDFQTQHGMTNWNGYRYWMGMTPYTFTNSSTENPSILASHDGYTWHVPAGQVNPVVFPGVGGGYNSDTELVYDATSGRLVLYWRKADSAQRFRASWSTTGNTWSTMQELFIPSTQELSPSVAQVGPGDWRMVTISGSDAEPHPGYVRSASSPLGPWSAPAPVSFTYTSGTPFGVPWHFGMTRLGGTLYGLIDWNHAGIMPATSTDDGATWVTNPSQAITQRVGMWDQIVYRACLTPHEDGDKFRVWYSANDGQSPNTWRTGYTVVPLSAFPAPPA